MAGRSDNLACINRRKSSTVLLCKAKKNFDGIHLPSSPRWAGDEVVYFYPPETIGNNLYLGASRKCEIPIKLM